MITTTTTKEAPGFEGTQAISSLQRKLQPFTLSPAPSFTLSKSTATEGTILHINKHSKWDWAIYRCTYGDDEAWTRFKQIITQQSHQSIAGSDTPEVDDSLDWTFVEDWATLDGASRNQLRSRLKAWAANAVRTENPQG